MDLRLQPKPEVKILPADKGLVSRKQFFVKKKFEEINQYFFPAHFIRQWKPKAELIYPPVADETVIQYECDFNRNVQSCFVEDYAEEVYLRTPPPCFVVIGKFGKSVSELSQKIADEFGSVLIRVNDIVNEVIRRQTETSKILDRLLRLGVSLTLNFILALLSYVAHTAEARHRGYVLCGLPSPPLSYDLSPDQQFNYLFTWENKPTVFINVLFNDEDLIKERTNLFCEIKDLESEKCILFHEEFAPDEDETEEEGVDDLMPIVEETCFEPNIDILPSRPWAQLPRDEESQVWSELEIFDSVLRPAIELINARVDPQYFITVDSRLHNEFELVVARLKLLQIWKAPIAIPFVPPERKDRLSEIDEDEEVEEKDVKEVELDFDISRIINEPPQTAFLTLFNSKTISPKYKWELSHYNYICPVGLREGEIVEGKSEFAVIFMKYIYFLRNAESVSKFIQNPRAFVLPIRPRPLCRFFILGYPFSGKTTLAKALADEYSIPIIDANEVLKSDSMRKKNIYQKFCQQKAECRETIRLTSLAWQDWRIEEEKRINLIEDWILYIQNILNQRIEQFYSAEIEGESVGETQVQGESPDESKGNVWNETHRNSENRPAETPGHFVDVGTTNPRTSEHFRNDRFMSPSAKIIQAMKHEDFNFNDKCLEVEANLFFSSLWKSFSNEVQAEFLEKELKMEEDFSDFGEFGEGPFEIMREKSEDSVPVDWCSLLPPQSLSTLLISKKPYTTREKRQSFKIFLEAASKAYWEPSALKSEFAKWRLPCFMDIPLCEIFLDNPILLLKYVPEWLKERPLIPDPIDSQHPSVVEEGRKAFFRAAVVTVKPNQEEMGILLRDAIEKAEREGMRVSGEIISPGGWVVDNMTSDLDVWNKLACESVFPDHIYILIDTEPDFRRIITLWWELCGQFNESNQNILQGEDISKESEEAEEEEEEEEVNKSDEDSGDFLNKNIQNQEKEKSLRDLLIEAADAIVEGEEDLDTIFKALRKDVPDDKPFVPKLSVDAFCHGLLKDLLETLCNFNDEMNAEEALLAVQTLTKPTNISQTTAGFFHNHQLSPSNYTSPLGHLLENFTDAVLNYFQKKPEEKIKKYICSESYGNSLEFFLLLLTLPKKLEQLKDWLISIERDATVEEIEITGRSCEDIFEEIKKNLMTPFIKKPRELEEVEIEEIKKFSVKESSQTRLTEEEFENEILEPSGEIEEDLRIFGESGPLCVVSLERDIFLIGKPEFALKYYGKLYFFWNEGAKNKFIENPEKYAPYYSAIRCYPPLRVFVVGPLGSGKTTLAKSLANQFSVTFVDFPELLIKALVPYLKTSSRKFITIGEQKLLLAEEHNVPAKIAKQNFMNSSYEKRAFWLESPLYSDFFNSKKIIDKLINLVELVEPKTFPELTFISLKTPSEEKLNAQNLMDSATKSNIGSFETPYVSMKEIEAIISNYLQNNSDLTDYCIDRSLKDLWTQEPYITQGFVLEGFPARFPDIKHIIDNNWIPDLVVEILLSEDDITERNLDVLMEFWDTKLKQETVEEKLIEDTVIGIQKVFMSQRRSELIKAKTEEAIKIIMAQSEAEQNTGVLDDEEQNDKKEELKNNSESVLVVKSTIKKYETQNQDTVSLEKEVVLPDGVGENIEEEVEKILKGEFPSFEFNSVFETFEAGKSRILGNLSEIIRRDTDEINKIRSALNDLEVSWLQVDGLKDSSEILRDLILALDKVKKRSGIRGEFSFTMSMEMAEKLLEQGYYFLSKFGRLCPVQVYQMNNPIHMFRPFTVKRKVTPIAYRNYIYFVAGENEKKKFMEDPIKYTFNDPHHPSIPLRVAVIGPPKSGKSTLCKRLGITFDLKVVTMGTALRFVLEKTPQSTLAKTINSYLRRGCFLSLSLKVEALLLCLNDPSCVTQGFVFDGIPFDAALTQSLAEKGKLPFVVISLVADPYFGKINRQGLDLNQFRLPYKNRTNLDTRYKDWDSTYKRFAQWNQDTYNNLYEVNAKLSVVDIFYKSYDIIRRSYFGILNYVENCVSDKVLPLHYLCVSQHEYELRKSAFRNNCPVCWSELKRLSSSTDPPPRSGLVQYLNFFYWICPGHMKKFTENPKLYFPPNSPKCPELLPKRLSRNALEKELGLMKIHGYGRCPVIRIDFPSSLDWEGSYDFAALYADEVFLCKNEEMLDRFLSQPWRYCHADTQFEVDRETKSNAVEQLGPPKMTSLPPIGFLEQTVANLIHECLQILGAVRPVYPNMTPTTTGCIFVALYLKVYNKENKTSHLERQYLDFMLEYCKAYRFQVSPLKSPQDRLEMGQGDYELDIPPKSDSSSECSVSSRRSSRAADWKPDDRYWLDLENQVEKNLWSARYLSEKITEMKFTLEDELIEIPEVPKIQAVLKYQTYSVRPNPKPPISNCLTVIYSCKGNMQLPREFNYNTLYQPHSLVLSPFSPAILFNPDKQFAISLYSDSKPDFPSKTDLRTKTKFSVSESDEDVQPQMPKDPDLELMIDRFVPRFQILDKIQIPETPLIPKLVEREPMVFNPHRDYAYMLLFSEFFCNTHVLRCYEWDEIRQHLEHSNRLDKNLSLTKVEVDYFFKPRQTASMKSSLSVQSYQRTFDAATLFAIRSSITGLSTEDSGQTSIELEQTASQKSLINFMQMIILEKLNEIFSRLSVSTFSYDAYDIDVVASASGKEYKHAISIREALPYPPLPWDIISRPYNAYCSISSIFERPPLDDIAHERHISLLDGVAEPNDLRFVSCSTGNAPPAQQIKENQIGEMKTKKIVSCHKPIYFVYDFFNLPWSSFLTYPFPWAYNVEITHGFSNDD